MFPKSLQWRLVSFFCIIAVALIIPIGLFLNNRVEDSHYRSFTTGVKTFLEGWSVPENADNPQVVYKRLQQDKQREYYSMVGDTRSFTVFDVRNNDFVTSDRLADNDGRKEFLSSLQDSTNFIGALNNKDGKDRNEKKLSHLKGNQKDFFDYAERQGNFVLYFRYYSDAWKATLDSFNKIVVSSLFIALIVAFILGYMLSKTITVPIIRVMHKAQAIAAGNFDQALEVRSDDEIGKLTSAFNHMAKNLEANLAEISSEKNKVATILNYMTDGVIAFNLEGVVIHANPAAQKILAREVFDDTFHDLAKNYMLDVSIEDIIYNENINSREFNIHANEKTLRVYFAVFSDESRKPEGIIAVLQDITEQRRLEDMRKEFVANVSHELRTPLTSIKSYAETLLDGCLDDRETAERFLKVINSEADRMTRLVKDLLQITRLDNRQMQWNMRNIPLIDLVKSCVDKMLLEAKSKNQQLECYVMGDIPEIVADYDRMEQVMMNILSNAIKYTPEGGSITVYMSRIYSEVSIKIVDTGIGIPEKDLPRIFERFYRVDKARSREMGGTGLGLAIAREIVEAHDGTITVKSEDGKGTEVTIRLPVRTEPV